MMKTFSLKMVLLRIKILINLFLYWDYAETDHYKNTIIPEQFDEKVLKKD